MIRGILWPADPGVRVLCLLLAVTLVRGVLYALLNPPFGSPDERAHFQFVQHLATGGAVERGAEGHQPMPYYALMVPAFWLAAGQPEATQLLAIRLFSIPLLLGVVLFTWLAARRMAPDRPFVWLVASSLVALHPQLAYIGASANNDNAANFMGAVLVFVLVTAFSVRRAWHIPVAAIATGAALMTKGQIVPMVAISAVVVAGRMVLSNSGHPKLLGAVFAAMFTLMAAAFLGTTEGTILIARVRSELFAFGRWEEMLQAAQQIGLNGVSYQVTSFWAAFQGESVRPHSVWYLAPVALFAAVPAWYLVCAVRGIHSHLAPPVWSVWLRVSLAAMILVQWLLPYLWHLTQRVMVPSNAFTLQLLQGRYMLLIMPAAALLFAEGWQYPAERRGKAALAAVILGALVALDVNSLFALAGHWQARVAG